MWTEITDLVIFRKKLLKFRQGALGNSGSAAVVCTVLGIFAISMMCAIEITILLILMGLKAIFIIQILKNRPVNLFKFYIVDNIIKDLAIHQQKTISNNKKVTD